MIAETLTQNWQEIPAFSVDSLSGARKQLHQAVQLVALLGRSLSPESEEDSYANLDWLSESKSLAGRWVGEGIRAKLNVPAFLLKLQTRSGNEWHLPLGGRTYSEAFVWMRQHLERLGIAPEALSLDLPYKLADYPAAKGEAFQLAHYGAFQTLSCWFNEAHRVLESLKSAHSDASEVKCWPHHFDIATRITLDKDKTVGAGMSPGDDTYNEPYFYVTPWPSPDLKKTSLPNLLSGGHWHTQGWVGAVLPASKLTSGEGDQATRVASFFEEALSVAKKID